MGLNCWQPLVVTQQNHKEWTTACTLLRQPTSPWPPVLYGDLLYTFYRSIFNSTTCFIASHTSNGCDVFGLQWFGKCIELFGLNWIESLDSISRHSPALLDSWTCRQKEHSFCSPTTALVVKSHAFHDFFHDQNVQRKGHRQIISHHYQLLSTNTTRRTYTNSKPHRYSSIVAAFSWPFEQKWQLLLRYVLHPSNNWFFMVHGTSPSGAGPPVPWFQCLVGLSAEGFLWIISLLVNKCSSWLGNGGWSLLIMVGKAGHE